MNAESATTTGRGAKAETEPRKCKARGRVTVVRDRCKGCGYCVAFCPTNALEMSDEFNDKGYHVPQLADGRDCTGCDLCGMYCPDFAIHGDRSAGEQPDTQPTEE
jgi:2-oxoglutarate ferredoxin oxidoreductase subunit delta